MNDSSRNEALINELLDSIPNLLGPALIGLVLNWTLLGVLATQIYVYYLCFPKDTKYVKLLVYGLFVLEIAQSIMTMSDNWKWLIESWKHPENILEFHLSWLDVPVMDGVISCIVQLYFARRIWLLGNSVIVPGIVALLAFLQCSAGIASGVRDARVVTFTNLPAVFVEFPLWVGVSAAVDVLIALAMTYYLLQKRTFFHETQVLLSRLIRLSIETGSVTAALAILDIILYYGFPKKQFFITPCTVQAKLYTNTLMVALNSRVYLQGSATNILRQARSGGTHSTPSHHAPDVQRRNFMDAISRNDITTIEIHDSDKHRGVESFRLSTLPMMIREIRFTAKTLAELYG
ncbi:hypothetical protein M422DRAFT_246113 [Sphaerobolus stellatus SS14]|nr:hypothetical protein M422DRAFT_246113 [Sphaerobolus stellatus SS14]